MIGSCRFPLFLGILVIAVACPMAAAAEPTPWPWQDPKAQVLPTGDLEWKPQPFVYVAGDSIRYIDYEGGNDANPGTRELPWQHHPWDPAAQGQAAAAKGIDTYVFKRGVMYRGAGGSRVRQARPSHSPDQRPRLGPRRGVARRFGARYRLAPRGAPEDARAREGLECRPRLRSPQRVDDPRRRRCRSHSAGPHAELAAGGSRRHQEPVVPLQQSRQSRRLGRQGHRGRHRAPHGLRHGQPDPRRRLLQGRPGLVRVRLGDGHALSVARGEVRSRETQSHLRRAMGRRNRRLPLSPLHALLPGRQAAVPRRRQVRRVLVRQAGRAAGSISAFPATPTPVPPTSRSPGAALSSTATP